MAEFAVRNRKFLTLVDTDASWVREAVDALRDQIDGAEGVRRLVEVRRLLEEGTELTNSARSWAERHMTVQRRGRGDPKVSFRNEAVREARRYFGYFALVTNQAMGTFEALRDYRMRERIEEFFGMDKRHFDGRRTRLWGSDALRGRQFAQFVGLGYLCRFRRMVDEVKSGLGAEAPGKPAALLRLEKGLKGWLADRATQDILDWFNCIETTQVETEAGKFRWATEPVVRDRLFLERLGLPTPNCCRVSRLLG